MWIPRKIDGVPDGIILFDGVCLLCSSWVRFVLARDPAQWFRFTPIQSPYGRMLAEKLGVNPDAPETNVVVVRGTAYFKSDTLVRVLERLPKWRWSRLINIVPRPIRNWVYDRIARNRYELFGKTDTCMIPTPDVTKRFVHDLNPVDLNQDHASLFQRVLGPAFSDLPAPVKHIHAIRETLHTRGYAEVAVSPGFLRRVICKIANLPPSGTNMPVAISFHADGNGREYWRRDFDGVVYESTLGMARNNSPNLLIEHFGPFDLHFHLTPYPDNLGWKVVGWRFLGLPLPRWSVPNIQCREGTDGAHFTFDISFALPLIGQVINYKGWIA